MNNKGSFRDDETFGTKIKGFFKESGFYIAIVAGLCVLAAGAVYFSTNQILTDPEPNKAQEDGLVQEEDNGRIGFNVPDEYNNPDQSSIIDGNGSEFADEGPYVGLDEEPISEEIVEDGPAEEQAVQPKGADNETGAQPGQVSGSNEQAQATSGNASVDIKDNAATEDVVLAIVRPGFISPVNGSVQNGYSMDKLVFSPTFNEWRTHSGVDISAPRGEVVRSVGDGVVLEIKNDPRFGFTVVIDHGNGYKSLYANLASDKTLQVGQNVKQGDPIGSVGATAIFESAEPTHLHFELYKENKLVDPADYIDLAK